MVQWRGRRQSDNVEDRRGQGGGGGFPFPGGRGGLPFPMPGGGGRRGGGIGIVGLLIMLGIALLLGINPLDMLTGGGQLQMPRVDTQGKELPKFEVPTWPGEQTDNTPQSTEPQIKPGDDLAAYIKTVLADSEDVWNKIFQSAGRQYREPKLVLFSGQTQTACGAGLAQMGPFYCPLDQQVYIDLDFYEEMRQRFGAEGDFAQAYVIAHEVGHHVQKLLGVADQVQSYKQQVGEREANAVQVLMELQADCYAGVWAAQADRMKGILEQGDIEEGLNAASAIGDDNIQKQTQGRVVPDAFTHGSSEQRVRWFKQGLQSGNPATCNTFESENP